MSYERKISENLTPATWVITGVAGFIGSHLLERLLRLGQHVVGLDNFSTGHRRNLDEVSHAVGDAAWRRFVLIDGDTRDLEICEKTVADAKYVLHLAGLGSVPRSLKYPLKTHDNNVNGFLNVLDAVRRNSRDTRLVYASSSSVYGDHPALPKVENLIGRPLSHYAVAKNVNEMYAESFGRHYGVETIGLRYFNVFGSKQNTNGEFAAVIPHWFHSLLNKQTIFINGDGETSRDFCFIDNVVQANLLAATVDRDEAINQVFNVAYGERTTLNQLYRLMLGHAAKAFDLPETAFAPPVYREFRDGDVRHSLADIGKARRLLGYEPTHSLDQGLELTAKWFVQQQMGAHVES